MKVGSNVTATITVTDDGGTTYTLVGGSTIGGFTLDGLSRSNSTTYTVTFTVTNGGTDVAAGSDIPVSVTLSDGVSSTYSMAISQNADPIDANNPVAPTISGISAGSFNTDQTFTVSGEAGATIEYSINNGGLWATYSGAVTVSSEGTYNVLARQTDQAGNGPTTSGVITLTIDKTNPVAPVISDISAGYYNTNQTFTVNGEAGATIEYSTNNGGLWTAYSGAVTLSAEGTYNVLARQTDLAGNGPITSGTITVIIDKTASAAPVISGISAGTYSADQIFTVSGEAGATIEYSTNNGGLWTTYTGAVTLSSEGTYNVLARQTDQAGNGPTTSGTITVIIDKTIPAKPTGLDLSDLSDSGVSDSDNITNDNTPTFTGSAEANSTVKLFNGVTELKSGTADGSGGWTITLNTLTDGNYSITAKVYDAASNESPASDPLTITIDTEKPSPTINSSEISPTNTDPIPFSVSFTEDVYNFDLADITVAGSNTVKQNLLPLAGPSSSYTFEVDITSLGGVNINVKINIAAGLCQDAAGNTNVIAIEFPITFDSNRPAVLSITPTTTPTNASPINLTVQFDEDVYNFISSDLVLSNCAVSSFNQASGDRSKYYVNITPTADGIVTLDIPQNVCVDNSHPALGNYAATQYSVYSDRTKPTPTITSNALSDPTGFGFTATIEFVEDVTGFDITDIDITNANKGAFVELDNSTYTLVVNPIVSGAVTVVVLANKCLDLAGNSNIVSNTYSIQYDNTPPTVLSVGVPANGYYKVGQSLNFTVNFSKVVNVNTAGGTPSIPITLNTGGIVQANYNGGTGTSAITFQYTVIAGNIDLDGISVGSAISLNLGTIKDAALNNATLTLNSVGSTTSVFVDTEVPTLPQVNIFSNNSSPDKVGIGGKVFISFTANENLNAGSVNVKITSLDRTATVTGSGKNWIASYTLQSDDPIGLIPFKINYNDLAGNSGAEVSGTTNSSTVTFDNLAPTLLGVSVVSDNTPNTSARTGSNITIQFNSTESIEGVTIKLNGKTVSAVEAPANTFTANYNMLISDTEGPIYVTIDCKDLSGNPAVQVVNNAITFDKTNPALSYVNIKSNNTTNTAYAKGTEVVTLTFTSNENIKPPAVVFNSLPATTVTGGPRNWIATYTLIGTETESIIPFSIPIVDLAGNASTVISTTDASSVTIDRTSPPVTPANVTVPAGTYGIGSVIIVTIPTDGDTYTGHNITVNGYPASIVYAGGNTYKVYYTVLAAHSNYSGNTIPINVDLTDKAGNITNIASANVVGGPLLTINLKPAVRITGSTTKCDYSWQKIPITFTFTGEKPYQLSYRFTSSGGAITDISAFEVNADSYTIDGVNAGTYSLISLTDNNYVGLQNSQTTAIENATITVNPLPSLTFNVTASPYSLSQPADNLSKYVNLTPATFWGNGVGPNGNFYPSIAGSGLSTVYYSYTDGNGCKDTITYNIIVGTGAYLIGFDSQYCKNIWAKTDTITVTNVTWGPSITDENYAIPTCASGWSVLTGQHKIVLDPENMIPGTHTLTYSYKESGVPKSVSSTFKVYQVSFNLDLSTLLSDKYCRNSADIELTADNHLPAGGVSHFTGPVTGFIPPSSGSHKAIFSPSTAPLGSSTISYYYFFAPSISSPTEGCSSDTIKEIIEVNPKPSMDFTLLKSNYNYDEAPVLLTGVPANDLSFFTSELTEETGIDGQAMLNPKRAFKFGEDIRVTYSYTDKTTGCSDAKLQTTKVYRADTPIKVVGTPTVDLKSVYCYRDTILTISCIPIINGIPKTGVFSSKKNGVSPLSPNTAEYSLKKAGEGLDTLTFSYDIDGTAYKTEEAVFIDSIGNVSLNLYSNFCKNGVPVTVQPTHRNISGQNTFTYDGHSSAFISNPLFATFSPQAENVGTYLIKYTFKSDKGCSNSISYPINVRPIPSVDFDIIAECGSVGIDTEIAFKNNTSDNTSTIANWLWDWADGTTSTLEQPGTHKFAVAGSRDIKLTATTNFNCAVTATKSITVGVSPIADFTWDNDCKSLDSVSFIDKSLNGTFIQWIWKLDDSTSPKNSNTIRFKLPEIKKYNVELTAKTNTGCFVSVKKAIVIQPYVKFQDLLGRPYSDNFETDTLNWYRKDNSYTSWTYGIPSGEIFSTSSSNTKAWFTKVGLANQKVENSQIVSSCFDLTGLKKPMVKLNFWSASEAGRDGAVLQYSTNGGQTWGNVGEANKGINWYETYDIRSQPAGQPYGWSGSDAQTGWKTARYTLDNLKDSSNVRFRIVYANKAENNKPYNGFAFDDFWIGERQQSILGEYFTNTTSSADNGYIRSFEKRKKDDIISIHYHLGDGLFDEYTDGPSSRRFYYGVSTTPSIFANGTLFSTLSDKVDFEAKADAATLLDPKVAFDTLYAKNGDVIMKLKALTDLSGQSLVLYCALVKDSVDVGGTYYYNVLRRFFPNPGGVSLTGTWVKDQVVDQSIPMNITTPAEFINAKLVAFVQNSITNEIYQVASYQTSTLTGDHPIDIGKLVDVYPIPARDYLIIECEHSIDRLMVFDLAGRVVGTYTPAQTRYSLPVQDLQNGLYILKGTTKKGEFIRKFVKQ